MTLPAFSAVGTGSETAPAWPTHATGDFGMLFVETASGTITTPTDWMKLLQLDHGSTSLGVFYRFATSASETAPSLAGGFNHLWGVIIAYTGVNTANPFHAFSQQPRGSDTSQSYPGIKTQDDDCMIVGAAAWAADNAGPLAGAPTNSGLGSLTERFDGGTITGNGGGLVIVDGTLATHTTIQPTTFSISPTSSAMACVTLALQAADKLFSQTASKSRIVNTGM